MSGVRRPVETVGAVGHHLAIDTTGDHSTSGLEFFAARAVESSRRRANTMAGAVESLPRRHRRRYAATSRGFFRLAHAGDVDLSDPERQDAVELARSAAVNIDLTATPFSRKGVAASTLVPDELDLDPEEERPGSRRRSRDDVASPRSRAILLVAAPSAPPSIPVPAGEGLTLR